MVTRELREGSTSKRELILTAARELFLANGFAGTKMDAIAARSGITKRTIYDYYGDKRGLFIAVVEHVMRTLDSSVHGAIEENLTEVDDLEASLLGFARSITASALGSSEYADVSRLLAIASTDLPETTVPWSAVEPEQALARRFADFDHRGLMSTPNPRRAADHFVALTLSMSASTQGLRPDASLTEAETDQMIVDGTRAFLRAYSPQPSNDRTEN